MPCILYRKENVKSGLIHPSGKMIALSVSSNVNTIELYRIEGHSKPIKLMWSYRIRDGPTALGWCNDGNCICIGDVKGSVTIIETGGRVVSRNALHSQSSEVVQVKSFMVGGELSGLGRDGAHLRRLRELVIVEPYSLNVREVVASAALSSDRLVRDLLSSREKGVSLPGTHHGGSSAKSEHSASKSGAEPDESQNVNDANVKEPPCLLPEFCRPEEPVSMLLTVDSRNNLVCSMGGHTPVWLYSLNDFGEQPGAPFNSIHVLDRFVVALYLSEEPAVKDEQGDLVIEIVDIGHFKDSIGLLFNTFGFLQYMRQLLNYLRGVFLQLLSVWTAGIKPFRQLIANEKAVRRSDFLILLRSLTSGVPANMFQVGDSALSEITVTIDQLVMIGQNVSDSLIYIESVLWRTARPVVEQLSVAWNVARKTEILEDLEVSEVERQVRAVQEFHEGLSRRAEAVRPTVHTFLHILSVAKTYRDGVRPKRPPEGLTRPKIISSVNSNIISSTFGVGSESYDAFKKFLTENELLKADQENSMKDESRADSFFREIEFRKIDQALSGETDGTREPSFSSIAGLSAAVEGLYRQAVNKVSEKFVARLSHSRVKLDSALFSSPRVLGDLRVSMSDCQNAVVVSLLHPVGLENLQYLISKIRIRVRGSPCPDNPSRPGPPPAKPRPELLRAKIRVEHFAGSCLTGSAGVSVSCCAVNLPGSLSPLKVSSALWTRGGELLMLVGGGPKSSQVFSFNPELI
ncbi:Transcription initiation factor TFIID subunit, partial [Cryptosporidium felis]